MNRQAWIAEYDRLCDLIIKLTNARNHGDRDTRPTFNALVAAIYEHQKMTPDDLVADFRTTVSGLLDDYLRGEIKAA